MNYEIVIPPSMQDTLLRHLLTDRAKEQMAILLCGLTRSKNRTRLFARHVITMVPGSFSHQSSVGLELDQSVQKHVLGLAAREELSQIDFHTHPGEGSVHFSGIDDQNEKALAKYLAKNLPTTIYASVVLNGNSADARVWEIQDGRPTARTITPPISPVNLPTAIGNQKLPMVLGSAGRYDRQIRAFGYELQRRLSELRVGVVGVGGLGSIVVEELTRLGVRDWMLVDPDIVEKSNLNRLLGATDRDVEEEAPKVEVARRNIKKINPKARVKTIRSSVTARRTLKSLKECGLLVASTDNHVSRLVLNALSCQFLIPLVHVGVNLEPNKSGGFEDISGEVVIPAHGEWCLLCGGVIDAQHAAREIAPPEEKALLLDRGYLPDTPAPAVYHLNALVASLAVTEIHNFVWPYKPLRRYLTYRELEGDLMSVEVPKSEGCLHCGPEGLLGLGDLAPLWKPKPARTLLSRGIPSDFGNAGSNHFSEADK